MREAAKQVKTRRALRRIASRPEPFAVLIFSLVAIFFYGSLVWTGVISLTGSRLLPTYNFVGFDQYERLWSTPRWNVAVGNMAKYGGFYIGITLAFGIGLAILLDRKIRAEGVFRTIFLYPYAVSFVVTGLAWRWLLEPTHGIQHLVRSAGWESFSFNWLGSTDMAIYTIVFAGTWRSTGLVMVIMLAGLRSVDPEIWKAIRIEGIPKWRGYLQVVIPTLKPVVFSCLVLLTTDVIRAYDLVVVMTNGGPGISSDLPAKFAVDHFFGRANIGLASAASIILMGIALVLLVPFLLLEIRSKKR